MWRYKYKKYKAKQADIIKLVGQSESLAGLSESLAGLSDLGSNLPRLTTWIGRVLLYPALTTGLVSQEYAQGLKKLFVSCNRTLTSFHSKKILTLRVFLHFKLPINIKRIKHTFLNKKVIQNIIYTQNTVLNKKIIHNIFWPTCLPYFQK